MKYQNAKKKKSDQRVCANMKMMVPARFKLSLFSEPNIT